ncbi:conserved exported protein of unknown function [Magnetospirillum gryphiswaldense MSR-1 v2]|uniref:Secreted protein n=1 Tax=Magnetospirillum gryphiswaldense (strain DSM 6361 / JCM 21280 / NBRC 15271 / MSR-1) TaxID=431944 RepID=V6F8Q6_MAGGM|nr:conserved exported protein of unknown function [Magnetospirillum gryphiswaldense]CDL01016.1 conserved exported protein of unknown function [Magnetospirillum gryphiswaldense MSR-1 v2]
MRTLSVVTVALCMSFTGAAMAGSDTDAREIVKNAVAVIKQYGTADGANLLNDGYGDVHRHDMTVAVYKKNGVVLAHPRKGLVGRDLSDNRGDDIHCERLAEVDVCAISAKR